MRTQHTLQPNVNCAVESSAVPKVTQSRNFNCANLRNFQHTLDLTAQLLTVQLKFKIKLYVCGGPQAQARNEWSLGLQSVHRDNLIFVRSEVPKAVVGDVLVISGVCVPRGGYMYSTASIFRATEQVQGDAVPG